MSYMCKGCEEEFVTFEEAEEHHNETGHKIIGWRMGESDS